MNRTFLICSVLLPMGAALGCAQTPNQPQPGSACTTSGGQPGQWMLANGKLTCVKAGDVCTTSDAKTGQWTAVSGRLMYCKLGDACTTTDGKPGQFVAEGGTLARVPLVAPKPPLRPNLPKVQPLRPQ